VLGVSKGKTILRERFERFRKKRGEWFGVKNFKLSEALCAEFLKFSQAMRISRKGSRSEQYGFPEFSC
jgi:hypothetical protein